MTTRTLTRAERAVREHVLAINLGRCTWCDEQATNACHRLPEGQGGPYIIPNLLPGCGSGTYGDHWRTEQQRTLSYACGWLLRSDVDPHGRNARIAATPALIRSVLAPDGDWHLLDVLEDGHPLGLLRLAEPDELPGHMFPGSFTDALAQLHRLGTAA